MKEDKMAWKKCDMPTNVSVEKPERKRQLLRPKCSKS
jgi:hypothetical protein